MVVRKRKKVTKYRASTTHGGGHRKKRRGAGSRGGRGNAGTGKRAGQKKAGIAPRLGSKGFSMHRSIPKPKTVNLSYFTTSRLEGMVQAKLAAKESNKYVVELAALGFDKLLGSGKIGVAVNFTAKQWSSKAAEKITAAGGSINAMVQKAVASEKSSSKDSSPSAAAAE